MPRSAGGLLAAFSMALLAGVTPGGAGATRPFSAWVFARRAGAPAFEPGPIQARLGESIEATVVVRSPDGAVWADAPAILWRGRRVAPRPLPPGSKVEWLRVDPHLRHVDRPSPNPGLDAFSNNVLFGPRHGTWIGFDRLEYDTRPLGPARAASIDGAHVRVLSASPSRADLDVNGGAGSIWLAAVVTVPTGAGEIAIRTPDGSTVDHLGLSPEVLRVSLRTGDDFLGWLSSYFNVPNVFGSAGPSDEIHQTERYVGADCADVLVGALRAAGRRRVRYTSVDGIGEYANTVTPVLRLGPDGRVRDDSGVDHAVRWGADVRPGDLLAIDYLGPYARALPRSWDHIGALVLDRGPDGRPNGVLDGADVLRHVAEAGLMDLPLGREAPIRFRVWRWRVR